MRSLLVVGLLLTACSSAGIGADDAGVEPAGNDAAIDAPGDVGKRDAAAADASADPGDAATDAATGADVDAGPTELVHFVGRFDTTDPKGPRAGYPGSAISATFAGTGISAALTTSENYFDVSIDGAAPTTLHATSATTTYPLATGLAPGTHTVSLVKRTESNVATVRFGGFTVTGGSLTASPVPSGRRIEMIGDSITCGYGDLGQGPSCPFTPATEDEDVAWGAVASAALGALHTSIAYSGRGLVRNFDGSTTGLMPELWTRTLADDASTTWDFSRYTPDVVVINLGTNDFAKGDPGAPFQAAYVSLLAAVRSRYPSAHIVGVVGPMLGGAAYTQAASYVQSALQASGDANVSYLALPTQDGSDGYGCDAHPSEARQAKMAAALTTHLKQVMGW